ncbi:MAG: PIN domain-containing protein [Verrucomicrobiae bacterium]|nr:PIN domain-containing protein [Verrucomicrobiae bacterium]
MRLLIDCDVLLDVALGRTPHSRDSGSVLTWAEKNPGQSAVAWHSLANLHYLTDGKARHFIFDLLHFVEIAPVSTSLMQQALSLPMNDLEDAMQSVCASAFGAQLIVTRNIKDYQKSPVPALKPVDFCRQFIRP